MFKLPEIGTSKCGLYFAIIGGVVGLLLATIGFLKMLLVLGLAVVGFIIGAFPGKFKNLKDQVQNMVSPKSKPNDNTGDTKGE